MSSNGVWPTLAKVANLIGIVWAVAALSVLGYFLSLGIRLIRHGG
jgi:hypothetical protein